MARPRRAPIPLTIVAGPLGAGKTTLINRLLQDAAFANTAVILNEFGATMLQNALVERAEDGIIALGAGCICCAVRGELIDALERLLRDLDNGRIAAIGRVIVESDASADPAQILAAVGRHPYLAMRFRPDGIVAVLPAEGAATLLAGRRDTVRQAAMADVVAVSGLAADQSILQQFARLNPRAAIVDAAVVPAAAIAGHGAFEPGRTDIEAWLGPATEQSGGETGEASRIHFFAVARARPMPLVALDRLLDYLSVLQAPNLVRLRGLVATGDGESVVVEGIGSLFRPPLMVTLPPQASPTRFMVVATDLDRPVFESYLDAFLNEAQVDTPDRDALIGNPLHIAGFSARGGR